MLFKYLLLVTTFSLPAETLLFENFDSTPWEIGNWQAISIEPSPTYHYSGEYSARISAAADCLVTPELNNPALLTLYSYQTSENPNLFIEVSADGKNFSGVAESPFSGTPEVFNKITADLPPTTTHIRFRKEGRGTFYLDDILITSSTPYATSINENITQDVKHHSRDLLVYVIACNNSSSDILPLDNITLKTTGNYTKEELTALPFKLYKSADSNLSSDDTLLSQRAKCSPGTKTEFKLMLELQPKETIFLLLSMDLAAQTYPTSPKHTITFNPTHTTGIFEKLSPSEKITINQIFTIRDDFSDDNISINPTWNDPDYSFTVSIPIEIGEGSINYFDGTILCSKPNPEHQACLLESTLTHGSWEFLIGEGQDWNTSSRNNYSVVLISDQAEPENLKTPNADFNGYYIVNENTFKLVRQDGEVKTVLIDMNFPEGGDSTNENDGYSFRITRSNSGHWQIFIDEGNLVPTTLRGETSDNKWTESRSFALRTSISSPHAKRTIYFDNLKLKSIPQPSLDIAPQIHLYFETIDNVEYIKWIESNEKPSTFRLSYLKEGQWIQSDTTIVSEQGIHASIITGVLADDWRLEVTLNTGQKQTISPTLNDQSSLLSYKLEQGWNLVGPSGCPNFVDSLPQKRTIWGWNKNSYCIKKTHQLAAGLWVKTNSEALIFFTDSPQNSTTMLNLGWNLVSFSTSFSYNINELILFYYKDQKYHILDGQVEPFRAYWVFRSL